MPSPLVPMSDRQERLLYVDAKGSNMVMYSDELLGATGPMKLLRPGRLTDSQRAARTDLLAIVGAKITSIDSGITYESDGTQWKVETNSQQTVSITASQVSAPTAPILANTTAIYQLNQAPYTLYRSNGTSLLAIVGQNPTTGNLVSSNGSELTVTRVHNWNSRPLPSEYTGRFLVPDVGASGTWWNSDGARHGLVNGVACLRLITSPISLDANSTSFIPAFVQALQPQLLSAPALLEIDTFWASPSGSGGAKTPTIQLGSTVFFNPASLLTGDQNLAAPTLRIWISGNSAQIAPHAANGNTTWATSSDPATGTENTANALNLSVGIVKAVGTDAASLLAACVKLIRP